MKKIFLIVFGCFPLLLHSQNEYNINSEQQIINYSTGNLPDNANEQIVQYNQQKVQNPVAYR